MSKTKAELTIERFREMGNLLETIAILPSTPREVVAEIEEVLQDNTQDYIEVTLDNGSIRYYEDKEFTECPECKKNGVRGKEMCEGGGVTCIYCPYWFCY